MQQRLFISLLVTSACLSWRTPSAVAAEHVILAAPVRVVTSADPAIFPESWRKTPISVSGEPLAETHFARVRAVLQRALKKYPPQVLRSHLEAVYVLQELRYSGVDTGGTNSRTCVYVKAGDPAAGFTDAHLEGVFHAEFSSILLRNEMRRFDGEAWEAINPHGFRYLSNGVDAIKQRKADTKLRAGLHEEGFLKQYSQSSLENDLNGFATLLFAGDPKMWEIVDKYPKVKRKAALAIAFYQQLDPAFTEEYFRRLAK